MKLAIRWSREFLDQGWYGIAFDAAKAVPSFAGVVPDATPVLVAFRRMPAPWPDLRIELPITVQTLAGLAENDAATLENVEIELEDAAVRAYDQARRGNDPSGRVN